MSNDSPKSLFGVGVDVNLSVDDNSKEIIDKTGKPIYTTSELLSDFLLWSLGWLPYKKEKKEIKRSIKFIKFCEKTDKKIKKIAPNKRINPPANLVGRIAETSDFYFEDENISEMFSNLLSSSMNFDSLEHVQPSFVSVIKDLSSYDAMLLNDVLSKETFLPIAKIRLQIESAVKLGFPDKFRSMKNGLDCLNHCFIADNNKLNIELTSRSLSNLERLGLISINYSFFYTESDAYDLLNTDEQLNALMSKYSDELESKRSKNDVYANSEICLLPGMISITEYGKDFISICC